ncbi:MAG: NAD-dependent epimerase/dehydratase family protein, partial [Actinobacteria bacterium]|nr:NAD-dependent epimerase/dehydratase family protein [Actinomycetota bacterium]
MRVLVTGAAGFLGRHVARQFVAGGWNVYGFDVAALSVAGVEFHQGDLTEWNSIDQAVKGCDVVVHIGAIG